MLAPHTLMGWPRAHHAYERPFIAAEYRDLPVTGHPTARGSAANLELVIGLKPDLILDFGNEIRVLKEVGKMARHGWTVIVSTHNPSHALQLADQVIVLNEGKVFAQGQADHVITESTLSELYKTPIGIGHVHTTPICAPLCTT